MAKITGKPGKVSGNPSGPGEFEQEFYLTNKEAAALLRDLAQEIESGVRVEAVTDSWSLVSISCRLLNWKYSINRLKRSWRFR
jgi:amphi-Trp domain-containing protein